MTTPPVPTPEPSPTPVPEPTPAPALEKPTTQELAFLMWQRLFGHPVKRQKTSDQIYAWAAKVEAEWNPIAANLTDILTFALTTLPPTDDEVAPVAEQIWRNRPSFTPDDPAFYWQEAVLVVERTRSE